MPDVLGGLLRRPPAYVGGRYPTREGAPNFPVDQLRGLLGGGSTLGAIEYGLNAPYALATSIPKGIYHSLADPAAKIERGEPITHRDILGLSLLGMGGGVVRGGGTVSGSGPVFRLLRGGPDLVKKLEAGELGAFKTTRAGTIVHKTKKDRGYSVNLKTGEVPKEGVMAGMYPNEAPQTTVIRGGLLTRKDVKEHAARNRKALNNPKNFFGTWVEEDEAGNVIATYADVSKKFKDVRQATKFAEKTEQKSVALLRPGREPEFPKVGSYPKFVSGEMTPEGVVPYAQRLQEMGTAGREYMAQHPTFEWWRQPNMERVYGAQRMPQARGLLAATSTNTQPPPNVALMSEYMRRTIKGEPIIQPEFRVPETAMSGHRMPKPGARLGLETGKGGTGA